jgi:hypothetical protein
MIAVIKLSDWSIRGFARVPHLPLFARRKTFSDFTNWMNREHLAQSETAH